MSDSIRWGILGPGSIARAFATGLKSAPDAQLVAVGSRTQEKADAFGAQFGVPRRHAGYEALAQDPEVDIVYIATPHPMHVSNMRLCLQHGKAVLCEKPFTINAAEAEQAVALAREKRLFLMEAMWSRCFPLMARVRELVKGGAIGEPMMLQSDFGFRAGFDEAGRLDNPALGGGALLDVGIYPISLASMLFGAPTKVTGLAHLGKTGVDEHSGMLFSYAKQQIALLSTSIRCNTFQDATITGTEGTIRIHTPWWKPDTLTLFARGKEEVMQVPYLGNGMTHEAIEAMDGLRAGRLESAVMPLDESVAILRTMDELRRQWGVKYPME